MEPDISLRRESAPERRRFERLDLRYPVLLKRTETGASIEGETTNVSSSGFYCFSQTPLSPGEEVECDIIIPALHLGHGRGDLVLHCFARVTRIEVHGLEPGFGIAFRIDRYTVATAPG